MIDYFRPLRRKLGVVTLLTVLLLAVGCVRSFFVHDSIGVPLTRRTTIGVMSACNSLIWCVQYHSRSEAVWKITKWTQVRGQFSQVNLLRVAMVTVVAVAVLSIFLSPAVQ